MTINNSASKGKTASKQSNVQVTPVNNNGSAQKKENPRNAGDQKQKVA